MYQEAPGFRLVPRVGCVSDTGGLRRVPFEPRAVRALHVVRQVVQLLGKSLHVAAVGIGSKTWKQFMMFQFQELSPWRFQRGIDRGNLHCSTSMNSEKVADDDTCASASLPITQGRPVNARHVIGCQET